MARKQRKHTVEVFRASPRLAAASRESGKCSTCNARSSCSEATESLDQWLKRMADRRGDSLRIRVIAPSREPTISKAVERLKVLLMEKRMDITLTKENFEAFLCDKGPVIAVDGFLFFMGEIPDDERLQRALEISENLKASKEARVV